MRQSFPHGRANPGPITKGKVIQVFAVFSYVNATGAMQSSPPFPTVQGAIGAMQRLILDAIDTRGVAKFVDYAGDDNTQVQFVTRTGNVVDLEVQEVA